MITPTDERQGEIVETTVEEKTSDQNGDEMGSTTTTESASFSGEESFFEALGSDFRLLAASFRETAGGVARFVQRSALTVAAEFSRLEEDDIHTGLERSEATPLNLPWEIRVDGNSEREEIIYLKERILALSQEDSTFLEAHVTHDALPFCLDESRIQLIRRLLEVDENLAMSHARLCGRFDVKETEFWKNYFDRCQQEIEYYWDQKDNAEKSCNDQFGRKMSAKPEEKHSERIRSIESPSLLANAETSSESDLGFIMTSPPMSGNSAGGRSVESFVIIDGNSQR